VDFQQHDQLLRQWGRERRQRPAIFGQEHCLICDEPGTELLERGVAVCQRHFDELMEPDDE
jgi:hypothetical protein